MYRCTSKNTQLQNIKLKINVVIQKSKKFKKNITIKDVKTYLIYIKKICFISTGNNVRKIFSKMLIEFKIMTVLRFKNPPVYYTQ